MIRHIFVVTLGLTFFFIMKPMEVEVTKVPLQRSLIELLEITEPAFGDAAHTIDQLELRACQDRLIALKQVMSSVIDGLEIADEQLIVPGVMTSVPLYTASEWIQAAFLLAEKKHYEDSEFVTSDDSTVKECQIMLKKLWHFGLCLDLQHVDQKEAERLYINRMTRIGALLNYTDPYKQDIKLLREYAKIQVLQVFAQQPSVFSNPSVDLSAAFEQSAINLPSQVKKEKKTGCLTRCRSKSNQQEKFK